MRYNVQKLRKNISMVMVFAMLLSVVNIAPLLELSFAFASEDSVTDDVYAPDVVNEIGAKSGFGVFSGSMKFTPEEAGFGAVALQIKTGGTPEAPIYENVQDLNGPFDQNSQVRIAYDWSIEDGTVITAGNYIEVNLPPAGFAINMVPPTDVIYNGQVIGQSTVQDGKFRITFNAMAAELEDTSISGKAGIDTRFDLSSVSKTNPVEISIPISEGHSETIEIIFKPSITYPAIEKSGEADPVKTFNANTLIWTIDINKSLNPLTEIEIEDTFGAGQELKTGSVEVYKLNINIDGNVNQGTLLSNGYTLTPDGDNKGFTFKIDGPTSEAYRLVYKTSITGEPGEGQTGYTNEVTMGETTIKEKQPIVIQRGSLLEKEGDIAKFNPKEITWTIHVNKAEQYLRAGKVEDQIPAGLSLKSDSVQLFELEINGQGTITKRTNIASFSSSVQGGNILVVSLPEATTPEHLAAYKAYEIVYVTEIDELLDNVFEKTFTNEAHLYDASTQLTNNPATDTVTAKRGQFIDKWGKPEVDHTNKTITWNIDVNMGEHNIEGAKVEDILIEAGHKFTGEYDIYELTVTGETGIENEREGLGRARGNSIFNSITNPKPENLINTAADKFTIDFAQVLPGSDGNINRAYRIEYTTEITNATDPIAGIGTYTNSAKLLGSNITDKGIGPISVAPAIDSEVTKSTDGSIDYANKIMKWRLTVNPRKEPMKSLIITDTFDPNLLGLELVESSIKVSKGSTSLIKDTDYTVTVADPKQGFVVNFLQDVERDIYTITYNTKFDRIWHKNYGSGEVKTYQNHARFDWVETGNRTRNKDDSASYTLTNIAANNGEKRGSLRQYDREIDWFIDVNYLRESLSDEDASTLTISDTILGNQELLVDTVKIYESNVTASGTVTKSNEVGSGEYSIVRNEAGFTIIFPAPIIKSYRIEYSTKLIGQSQDKYENTARVGEVTYTATPVKFVGENNTGTYPDPDDDKNFVVKKQNWSGTNLIVPWVITVNASLSTISNLTVIDELVVSSGYQESGHSYDPTSFEVRKITGASASAYVIVDPSEYTLNFESIDSATGTERFTLQFNSEITDKHEIHYKTNITAQKNVKLENKVSLNGNQPYVENRTSEENVLISFSGGWSSVIGSQGKITIEKRDPENSGTKLANVKFQLHKDGKPFGGQITTDADGNLLITRQSGTYSLKEIEAFSGYQLLEEEVTLTFVNGTTRTIPVNNYKLRSLQIEKFDSENSSKKLENAIFTLEKLATTGEDKDATFGTQIETTNDNGIALFKNLPFGRYKIKETTAPIGYQSGDPITIVISETGATIEAGNATGVNVNWVKEQITLQIPNEVQTGNISFTKLGEKPGEDGKLLPLEGAKFILHRQDDDIQIGAEVRSDENGLVIFFNVPYGDYYIVETEVPEGYDPIKERINVSIDAGGYANFDSEKITDGKIANLLIRRDIKVIKRDFDTKLPLAKAQFELVAHKDNIIKLGEHGDEMVLFASPSNDNGEVIFGSVPYGKYTIKEVEAPTGYQKSDETRDISEQDLLDGEIVTFENHHTHSIVVTKVRENAETVKLQGAKFTLTKEGDTNFSREQSTDVDGIAKFEELSFGAYILKETQAPSGHILNVDFEHKFEITQTAADADKVYTHELTVTNKRRPSGGGGGGGGNPPPIPEPEKPKEPEKPVKPEEKPEEPKKPEEPNKPEEKPEEPNKPEDPNKPGENPGEPGKPGEQPEQPTVKEKTPEETPVGGKVEVPEQSTSEVKDPPKNGTVTVNEDGTWEYTPEPGFIGKDTFIITIKHPDGTEEEVFIEIEVGEIPLGAITPPGVNELPKTGEINPAVFYILGFGIILTGAVMLRRSKVLRGKVQ